MRESLNIVLQSLNFLQVFDFLNNNDFIIDDNKIVAPSRAFMKFSMSL